MRLHELTDSAPTFYLGSHIPLSGRITRADLKAEVHPRHQAIEALLEKARPEDCLSRASCVFLAESQSDIRLLGMPSKHIYRAAPVGAVAKSDLGWWHLIRDGLAQPISERPSLNDWAAQYWAGSQCTVGRTVWETRAEGVRISGLVGSSGLP